MNKQKAKTAAVSSLLTVIGLVGTLGCLASGMGLNAELVPLVIGCLMMALGFSFFWDTKLWFVPLLASLLILWWQATPVLRSLEGVIYKVSDLYDRGYGWGIVQWSDRNRLSANATPALLAMGLPLAGVLTFSLTRGRQSWPGAVLLFLPTLCTLLLKDTVPTEENIFY